MYRGNLNALERSSSASGNIDQRKDDCNSVSLIFVIRSLNNGLKEAISPVVAFFGAPPQGRLNTNKGVTFANARRRQQQPLPSATYSYDSRKIG
jgi:hypothetical protein